MAVVGFAGFGGRSAKSIWDNLFALICWARFAAAGVAEKGSAAACERALSSV